MSRSSKCVVSWALSEDGRARSQRLLDFLETHPTERAVLFSPPRSTRSTGLTKLQCTQRAATALFSEDPDPALRRRLREDPVQMRSLVSFRMGSNWPRKYKAFNKKIGRAAAMMTYEEISKDVALLDVVDKLMQQTFPEWARLHKFWRVLPHYNEFYTANAVSSKTSQSIEKSTSKSSHRSQQTRAIKKEHITPIVPPSTIAPRTSHALPSREIAAPPYASVSLNPISCHAIHDHNHHICVEEVRLRELDIEIIEKTRAAETHRARMEAEARRERDMHELRMRFMELTMGSGGAHSEGRAEQSARRGWGI